MNTMSIEEKIAQRIIVDIPGTEVTSELRKFLGGYPWGGVILFLKNIQNRSQVSELIKELQEIAPAKLPLFVAVDQEGGLIAPLGDLIAPYPGNMALGILNDEKITEEVHGIMARECRELGFNLLFAPVVDVNNNPNNPVIGVRSFGMDVNTVSRLGAAAVRGIQNQALLATAKHFPGHGDTGVDSHLALPAIQHTLSHLRSVELPPFQAAIDEDVAAIMTAHILFPALDSEYPATLSKTILTDLLRQEMGFNGLIVTDSLKMEGIRVKWDLGTAAVLAVKAGADILLSCGELEDHYTVLQAVADAYKKGELDEREQSISLSRVFAAKQKLQTRTAGKKQDSCFATLQEKQFLVELHKQAITVVRSKPNILPLNPHNSCVGVLFTGELGLAKNFSGELEREGIKVSWVNFFDAAALKTVNADISRLSHLIVLTDNRTPLATEMEEFFNGLRGLSIPIIGVAFNNPFHFEKFPQFPAVILTYNANQVSQKCVVELIAGKGVT